MSRLNARRVTDFTPAGIFGRDRGLTAFQLELPFWPRGTLREALTAYLAQLEDLADATYVDYGTRMEWLCEVFGERAQLRDITLEVVQKVMREQGPKGRGLMMVTLKKRLTFLRAAMKYAAGRRIITRDEVLPELKIKDDGKRGRRVLQMTEFRQLRLALCGSFRRFAEVAQLTGFHTWDVEHATLGMFEPAYKWLDTDGAVLREGRYLRKNHKTKGCEDAWLPMEQELLDAASEWKADGGGPDALVVGHVWAKSKAFAAARDRAGLDRVKPNQDLRRSFASLLAARGYSREYIRQAQGHIGAPQIDDDGTYMGAAKPTVDDKHYVRLTHEMILHELRKFRR